MAFNHYFAAGRREAALRFARCLAWMLIALLALALNPTLFFGAPGSPAKPAAPKPAPAKAPIARPAPLKPVAPKADASEPGRKTFLHRALCYPASRAADCVDVWKLNVGAGFGLCANLRPTKGLQAGFGAYDSVRVGLRGRRLPFWHEWSSEGGFDGMYWEGGQTERGFYEFGGTLHFIIIGMEMAVDIEELLDFAFGVFGADPADDDFR